jgi:hypothetical protein
MKISVVVLTRKLSLQTFNAKIRRFFRGRKCEDTKTTKKLDTKTLKIFLLPREPEKTRITAQRSFFSLHTVEAFPNHGIDFANLNENMN